MRGAGCAINGLWDRKLDPHVERTKFRPIAGGAISPRNAVLFTGTQLLAGLGVLLQFPNQCVWYGIPSLPIVVAYPLSKRVTNYPQCVLGLAISWGAIMGFPALGVDILGNHDASAIVARPTDTPTAGSFPRIIQAMKDNGVKQLIVIPTFVLGQGERCQYIDIITARSYAEVVRAPRKRGDGTIAEPVTSHATNLHWTIFQAPHLTVGRVDTSVLAGYVGPYHKGVLNLSRRSLARWDLEIRSREWIRGCRS